MLPLLKRVFNVPDASVIPDSIFNSLPGLRDVVEAHGLRADKSLGQNFLLDQNITDKIVRLAEQMVVDTGPAFSQQTIVEIGPGPGGLTRSLLRGGAGKVVAIEFDPRAVAVIQELQQQLLGAGVADVDARLAVIHGDALHIHIDDVADKPRSIVANLPYNISTVLLVRWLEKIYHSADWCGMMALMFQKEVADRLLAAPSQKSYGRLSVMAQWLCDVRRLYELPPSAFTPPPKISSTVVGFVPRNRLSKNDQPQFKTVERVLAAAFNQRRKMIRTSLKPFWPAVQQVGVEETLRAENISPAVYIQIAVAAEKMGL